MNLLSRTIIEVKIGERTYNFECSPDSPLGEINQALVSMNSYVLARIDEAQKIKEAAEEPVEVS